MSAFEITSEPTKDHLGRHAETTSAAGLNEMIRPSMVADEEKAAALAAVAEDGDALTACPAPRTRACRAEDELASAVEAATFTASSARRRRRRLTGSSSPSLDGSPSRKHVRRQSRVERRAADGARRRGFVEHDAPPPALRRLGHRRRRHDRAEGFERALIALGLVPNRDDARKLFELLDQTSGAVSVEELIRLKSAIEAAKRGRGARAEGSAAEQSRFSRANTQHGLFGGQLAGSASDPRASRSRCCART